MNMRKIGSVFCLFVLPCSLAFTWLVNHFPEYFPTLPQGLAIKLVELYGAQNAEQVADLEVIVGFLIGLVVFGLLAFLIFRSKSKEEVDLLE